MVDVDMVCRMLIYFVCIVLMFLFLFLFFFFFFFFQAEDGIRDLVRSRGLGDVYKRQLLIVSCPAPSRDLAARTRDNDHMLKDAGRRWTTRPTVRQTLPAPVSYTHLTLPTIYSV